MKNAKPPLLPSFLSNLNELYLDNEKFLLGCSHVSQIAEISNSTAYLCNTVADFWILNFC